jgi:Ca-activated chloride channel family protein
MVRVFRPLAAACGVLALLLGSSVASPAGLLLPAGPRQATPPAWGLDAVEVHAVVRGGHAHVRVVQAFRNRGPRDLEADYVFPLPAGARLSSVTLHAGKAVLGGELLRAEAARAAWLEILRRRRDPALLAYLGRDLYRLRGVGLPAGGTRRLELAYDQTLPADGGVRELVCPLAAARAARAAVHVEIDADQPLGPVYSPTHDVAIVHRGPQQAEVSYDGAPETGARDLVLYWSTTSRRLGATLLTYWPPEEDRGYFLYLAEPSADAQAPRVALPQDVTFVLDVSGSMAGEKLEQVRAALQQVVRDLRDDDRFNVVAYHSDVQPLWEAPRPATPQARKAALAFVDGLEAAGGTHIAGALKAALADPRPARRPAVVIFLTDGRPTMGERDPDAILASVARENPGRRTRIFVLGVGVDVNTVLLDRLALENRGAPDYVRPRESVGRKVAALYAKVRAPVLTDPVFAAPDLHPSDVLPAVLPDLFGGGQIVVTGRYAAGGPAELVLSGRDGPLEREVHCTRLAARRGGGTAGDFPARVWALRRIAALIDAIRLHGRRDPEMVKEIVRLGTRFGILTEYTSFLADESGVSHTALLVNTRRARKNLEDLTGRAVGGAGLAQAENQAERRSAVRLDPAPGAWFATPDDRDVRKVRLSGVRQVGNRTFYDRGRTTGWVDVEVSDAATPAETVTRWSERFFQLLGTTSPDENVRLAQPGPLLLVIQGRILRVVDPS